MKRIFTLSILILLIPLVDISQEKMDPSIIIQKMFVSLGGEESIEKLGSTNYIMRKIMMRKHSLEPRQKIEVVEYFKAPNKVRVEMNINWLEKLRGSTTAFVFFDGETKWTNLGTYPQKVTKTKNEMFQPSLNTWLWLLKLGRKHEIELLDEKKEKGRGLYRIKFKRGEDWCILYLDKNSFFPYKTIHFNKHIRSKEADYSLSRETIYENFKKINGVYIPFKSKTTSEFWYVGAHQALIDETEATIIELRIGEDIKLDDDFFNFDKLTTPKNYEGVKNEGI